MTFIRSDADSIKSPPVSDKGLGWRVSMETKKYKEYCTVKLFSLDDRQAKDGTELRREKGVRQKEIPYLSIVWTTGPGFILSSRRGELLCLPCPRSHLQMHAAAQDREPDRKRGERESADPPPALRAMTPSRPRRARGPLLQSTSFRLRLIL